METWSSDKVSSATFGAASGDTVTLSAVWTVSWRIVTVTDSSYEHENLRNWVTNGTDYAKTSDTAGQQQVLCLPVITNGTLKFKYRLTGGTGSAFICSIDKENDLCIETEDPSNVIPVSSGDEWNEYKSVVKAVRFSGDTKVLYIHIGFAGSGIFEIKDVTWATGTEESTTKSVSMSAKALKSLAMAKASGVGNGAGGEDANAGGEKSGKDDVETVVPADGSIAGLEAYGPSFDYEAGEFVWHMGVALSGDDGAECESASPVTFSATKLPSGVKIDKKTGMIYGTPKKAGTFSAKIKAKNSSRASASLPVTIRVLPIDAWATGTFDGVALDIDGYQEGVVQTMKITSSGKVSGKLLKGGRTYKISAPAYSEYDETTETYSAKVTCKSSSETFTTTLVVAGETIDTPDGEESDRGVAFGEREVGEDYFIAWQNKWTDKKWKTLAKKISKAKAVEYKDEGMTFKSAASGKIKAKYGKRSFSTILVPYGFATDEDYGFGFFVYFPAKKGAEGYSGEFLLDWNGVELK